MQTDPIIKITNEKKDKALFHLKVSCIFAFVETLHTLIIPGGWINSGMNIHNFGQKCQCALVILQNTSTYIHCGFLEH